jgi:bifunctional UDP-N-acetylglucosamine pyrophosphorylase/glucosamine-1-phosphate N-acetyltransferase
VLGFRAADPTGYGPACCSRASSLVAIREHADASPEERKVTLCNAGVMAFDGKKAPGDPRQDRQRNSKSEYYLVDAVDIVQSHGIGGRRDRNQRG